VLSILIYVTEIHGKDDMNIYRTGHW